jgi:two-component system sensor histidine kinase TctE
MKKTIQSIKSRLLISLSLPLSIGAIVLILIVYFTVQTKVNRHFDNTLLATAKSMEDSISIRNGTLMVDLPYFAMDLLSTNNEGLVFYSIVDDNGKVLVGYKSLFKKELIQNKQKHFYNITYSGLNLRAVSFKTSLVDAQKKYYATITIAETMNSREESINEILAFLFAIMAIIIIFTIFVSFFAVRNGLGPLYKLKEIVQKRDHKDLDPIHFDAPKEIEDAVNSINILLKRSRDTIKYIEQFNSDVSHQLRTPLAELKVQIEESHESDKWDYVEMNKLVNSMSHITEQLLLFAKTNPTTMDKTHFKKINLNSFCKDYALKVASRVYAKGFEFAFENLDENIEIEADEVMLRSMLDNIINNAIHYAVDEKGNPIGTISLLLKRHNNTIWLSIKDEGKGIDKKYLNSIFDRFYRVDSKKSGSGLGLNIVKQIATLHNAKVQASNDNGLKISIIFHSDKDTE